MIYFPPHHTPHEIEQSAASQHLECWLDTSGTPIGWKRLLTNQPAQGDVLVMHGNGGCAYQCGHYADVIQAVAPMNVFLLEYPGYENRPGSPSEKSIDAAADEAIDLLPTNAPIYLVGESLGTGVASYLAGKYSNKVSGVVLLAPYNSLVAVAHERMPFLPVTLLLRDRFPSQDYLRTYHGPLAVLVSGEDKIVPEKLGLRLFDSYNGGPKFLREFPDGDHGTPMFQPPKMWQQIIQFWELHPASHTNQSKSVANAGFFACSNSR